MCKVPCVTVEYKIALDKYTLPSDEVAAHAGGPDRGVCWVQLSRTVQFESVSEHYHFAKNRSFYFLSLSGGFYSQEC